MLLQYCPVPSFKTTSQQICKTSAVGSKIRIESMSRLGPLLQDLGSKFHHYIGEDANMRGNNWKVGPYLTKSDSSVSVDCFDWDHGNQPFFDFPALSSEWDSEWGSGACSSAAWGFWAFCHGNLKGCFVFWGVCVAWGATCAEFWADRSSAESSIAASDRFGLLFLRFFFGASVSDVETEANAERL